jgi:hypothetical protein
MISDGSISLADTNIIRSDLGLQPVSQPDGFALPGVAGFLGRGL